nr:prepilin-type N-terminal cleavage/methylation domain-containing protein [Psychromonas antarctica]
MESKTVTNRTHGFTLVELVVGIVVLAIAMMVMNTMLISQSKDALEPLYRLRASQLGQSIMQDILSRAYDQNSDHNGGYYRCGEIWDILSPAQLVSCTSAISYGPEGDEIGSDQERKHAEFNDVDDFITVGFVNVRIYGDVLAKDLPQQYENYSVKIAVAAETVSGVTMKCIDVSIKTPSNEQIRFSALKGNY